VGDTRADLIRLVREYPGSKPAQLADALKLPPATVRQTLSRMAKAGQLHVAPGGAYYPPEQVSDSDHAAPVTPVTPSLHPL
jgi:DNA-binding IclR family transcriptional regulator